MQTETTLTPDDFHVFEKIPIEWWDEIAAGAEIAQVLRLKSGNVLRRIARLEIADHAGHRHSRPIRRISDVTGPEAACRRSTRPRRS